MKTEQKMCLVSIKGDMDLCLPNSQKISLRKMTNQIPDRTCYEPELYHGCKVQWVDGMSLILFSTGKIMLTPAVTDQNRDALDSDAVGYLQRGVQSFVNLCFENFDHQ